MAKRAIIVNIATSADGFVARPNGNLDWLTSRPAPRGFYGLPKFARSVDAKILGRKTFDVSVELGARFSEKETHYVFSRRPPRGSCPCGRSIRHAVHQGVCRTHSTGTRQEHLDDGRRRDHRRLPRRRRDRRVHHQRRSDIHRRRSAVDSSTTSRCAATPPVGQSFSGRRGPASLQGPAITQVAAPSDEYWNRKHLGSCPRTAHSGARRNALAPPLDRLRARAGARSRPPAPLSDAE